MIVDDPIKLGDAYSKSARQHVIEWYRSTLLSRGNDKNTARIVVVMQRVSQNDLVGYLQESGGFETLDLPAVAQREETYQLSAGRLYTRKQGELLHPAHKSVDVLRELQREMDEDAPVSPGSANRCDQFARAILGELPHLSLSETQSCWQLISNWAMLLPYARGL